MDLFERKAGWYVPAGISLSREELDRLTEMTAAAGTWLVLDETYEEFMFSGQEHHCPSGPHVIHLFSFSKVTIIHRKGLTSTEPIGLLLYSRSNVISSVWQQEFLQLCLYM
jgi:hypothetical protein